MREPILLALVHIFAIITTLNPTGITERGRRILRSYLRRYLNPELEDEYFRIFENNLKFYSNELTSDTGEKLIDGDSLINFQITNICRQIKKGLLLEERTIVFLQLLEFAYEDGMVSKQEKHIVDIIARVFQISEKEYKNASAFMLGLHLDEVDPDCLLVVESDQPAETDARWKYKNAEKWKTLQKKGFKGNLFFLMIESTRTLMFTYDGRLNLFFRGREVFACRPYLLDRGVNIKGPEVETVFYSEIINGFLRDSFEQHVVFEARNLAFRFNNSNKGIKPMSFREESGNLVGIMGGSGVGKSTLLNLLNGSLKPDEGDVYIDGYHLHEDADKLKGLIGYIPQDDLLIEELSVYQNLTFNARLCFGDDTEEQIREKVDRMLKDLDLWDIRHLQVGDPLNKKISGGQRKRLNIALELIREPIVLFVDEPTSGLSSHDSEMVIELLKKQTCKGKLVFAILHQPSSNILKTLDKLWLLDRDGYMVYAGDPVESLVYLKNSVSQANAAESECPKCGNVRTDSILDIIELKEVDDQGYPIPEERQVTPEEWYQRYQDQFEKKLQAEPEKLELPASNFKIPSHRKQTRIFFQRNLLRKLSDRQYLTINLLEAPLLSIILSYFAKYVSEQGYYLADNKNYPVFLFMSVVVALFMGLMVSAEEIFKDRRILKRESYLDISRMSYLTAKISWLFVLSGVQTLSFIIPAALILEIRMIWPYFWFILFTTACFGNMVGLNLSSGLKSVVSIYIVIPLILVPQLLLGGAMIRFDDLHPFFTRKVYVPVIADLAATRWAYEGMAVTAYTKNKYERLFFDYEQVNSQNHYYASYLIPALTLKAKENYQLAGDPRDKSYIERNTDKMVRHTGELLELTGMPEPDWFRRMKESGYQDGYHDVYLALLDSLKVLFRTRSVAAREAKDSLSLVLEKEMGRDNLIRLKKRNHNAQISGHVLNENVFERYYETTRQIVQKTDPIYMEPTHPFGRAHFYSPAKKIGQWRIETFWYNVMVIWLMSGFLFITLYDNSLHKLLLWFEKRRHPDRKNNGKH